MKEDVETRRKIAQQGRLWLLSVICATAGAITINETGSLVRGIGVFLICVAVLGPVLFFFERRRRLARSGTQVKSNQGKSNQGKSNPGASKRRR